MCPSPNSLYTGEVLAVVLRNEVALLGVQGACTDACFVCVLRYLVTRVLVSSMRNDLFFSPVGYDTQCTSEAQIAP